MFDDADVAFFQPSQLRRVAMQFVAKHTGTDQLIEVKTEQMENGVLVRVDGVAVMQCLDNQQAIEVYTKRLEGRALTVKIVEG